MDALQRQQLIKQRSVARGMLSRIQNFIEAGDQKINDIQMRFNNLPDILIDMTQHRVNWHYQTTQVTQVIENYLKITTMKQANFNELLHPVVDSPPSRRSSPRSSLSGNSNHSPSSHVSNSY